MAFWAHLLGFFQVQGLLLGSSRSGFGAHAVGPSTAGELLSSVTVALHHEAARVHLQGIKRIKKQAIN